MNKFILLVILLFAVKQVFALPVGNEGQLTFEIEANKSEMISITIPFSRESLPRKSIFLLFSGDEILKSKVQTHLLWPTNNSTTPEHIRALSVSFIPNESKIYKLVWRDSYFTLPLGLPEYHIASVSYQKGWLSTGVYTPLIANNKQFQLAWYNKAFSNFGDFITDKALVVKSTKGKLSFENPSPWLYDHPYSLYLLYYKTGSDKWRIFANKAATRYRSLINSDGYFSLKENKDLKYLMASGLLIDYVFYPKKETLDTINAMYVNSVNWPIKYEDGLGFWTERHLSNAINLALTMWELTGELKYKDRVDRLVAGTLNGINNNSFNSNMCVQHYYRAHEGGNDEARVCSPWMNALVVEQLWRYVEMTGDSRAKQVIELFARQVVEEGVYNGKGVHLTGYIIPYYLKFYDKSKKEELNQWTDIQHACDVAAMVAKGAFIRKKSGQDVSKYLSIMDDLLKTCKKTMSRANVVKVWEISPLRKFNWWFSSTTSIEWLNEQLLISSQ
ncbi:MAG: hypothetical protein HRT53_10215 [Colwellia sp.]|nr:hypothetical protein [Colwellia sp.]